MPRSTIGPVTLDVPDAWTFSSFILAGPVDEDPPHAGRPFQRNLVSTIEAVGEDVDADLYLRRQQEGLRAAGVEGDLRDEPEYVELRDGSLGILTEQVIVGPEGERVRQMQLMTVRGGYAVTAIASHLEDRFAACRDEFREMLLSLE